MFSGKKEVKVREFYMRERHLFGGAFLLYIFIEEVYEADNCFGYQRDEGDKLEERSLQIIDFVILLT